MVLCWSLAEIVRFAYYSYTSRKMKAHPLVVWCRYNFFIALYPLGALCEFLLVQRSVKYLPSNSRILKLLYYTIMILYGPRTY